MIEVLLSFIPALQMLELSYSKCFYFIFVYHILENTVF